jgi:hypothetical protein
MKVLGLVLPTLLLLTTPVMAVEYQGKNIDGTKLAAKAYYPATGGVYNVQVRFKQNRATIYFDGGYQTTIQLLSRAITDPSNIEGFGKLGQISLNRTFSIGLIYDNSLVGDTEPSKPPLDGLWRISLDKEDFNNF